MIKCERLFYGALITRDSQAFTEDTGRLSVEITLVVDAPDSEMPRRIIVPPQHWRPLRAALLELLDAKVLVPSDKA